MNKIKNLATDIFNFILSGFKTSPIEVYKRRLEICNKCEFLIKGRCEKCGCFMGLKARIMEIKCPIDKW